MLMHLTVKLDVNASISMLPAMKDEPSTSVIRAWARLMRARETASAIVESALKEAGLPPLAWYDVLLELDRVGTQGLRPFELERELLLPQYGLSRLLNRIEAAGLLERQPCKEDRRGHIVAITTSGETLRRRMWPVYAASLQSAVGAKLSDDEAAQLGDLLGKLVEFHDG